MNALPYVYVPPDIAHGGQPATPLVVSVPHAGTRIPSEDQALVVADERTRLRDADLHVDRLYAHAANLGAHLISATVSRYVLDLNRSPHDVDRDICPEWGGSATPNAKGLIWRLSTDGAEVQARPLTRAEVQSRIARVHTPYHTRLRELLDSVKAHFGYAILLDAHSMPSVGRAGHSDTGKRRAHVVPGDNHGTSCSPALTALVSEHFRAADLTVAVNQPYSGGWITRHYGQPAEGVHAIQIELSRALYLHEEVPWWAGAPALELQRLIDALIPKLIAFQP